MQIKIKIRSKIKIKSQKPPPKKVKSASPPAPRLATFGREEDQKNQSPSNLMQGLSDWHRE